MIDKDQQKGMEQTESTIVLVNYPIYAVEGVIDKSQIKVIKIGEQMMKKGASIDHTNGPPFQLDVDVIGVINICKFTKDDVVHYRKCIPILFISVWHTEDKLMTMLFQIFFDFKFNEIVPEEQFLSGEAMDGKFILEVVIEDEKEQLDSGIPVFKGCTQTVDHIVDFLKNDVMKAYIRNIINENKAMKKKTNDETLKELLKIPKVTVSMRYKKNKK